jgi:hypothetical protein
MISFITLYSSRIKTCRRCTQVVNEVPVKEVKEMKVQELIDLLQKVNPNMDIFAADGFALLTPIEVKVESNKVVIEC